MVYIVIACHVSCALECTGPGKAGCVECRKGYEQLNGSCEGKHAVPWLWVR